MYILDNYLNRYIKEADYNIKIIASKIGVSQLLFDKYNALARNNPYVEIVWFNYFDIRKNIFYSINSLINVRKLIKSSRLISEIYFQSGDNFLSRYVLYYISKYSPETRKIGLTLSIPPLLFRDPKFITGCLPDNSLLKKSIDRRILLLEQNVSSKKSSWKLNVNFKQNAISILEKAIEIILLPKVFRNSRLIKATSYFNKSSLDSHITTEPYWKYILSQIYKEPVRILRVDQEVKVHDNGINSSERTPYTIDRILLLGPTSIDMAEKYHVDVNHLMQLVKLKEIKIRPHPRYIEESVKLRQMIEKSCSTKDIDDITVTVSNNSFEKDFCSTGKASYVLGYFSTVFIEVNTNVYHPIISESGNNSRYPLVDINILSGEVVNMGSSFSRLSILGEWYCPINNQSLVKNSNQRDNKNDS